MDKLIQMIEIATRSDVRVKQIEKKCYNGEIKPEEAIDLIDEETQRLREQLHAVKTLSEGEYGEAVRMS